MQIGRGGTKSAAITSKLDQSLRVQNIYRAGNIATARGNARFLNVDSVEEKEFDRLLSSR